MENVSDDRKRYLQNIQKQRRRVHVSRFSILFSFLLLWEVLTHFMWLDPFIFSSPLRIVKTLVHLTQNSALFEHIFVTFYETLLGFTLGTALGILCAIVLWWCPLLDKVFDPFLVVLNALPKIALGPVLIVWMGTGMEAIVTIAVLISVVVTITSVLTGFNNVQKERILLLKSFGANKFQVLQMVVLPSNVPVMVSAFKLSVGMSFVGVIVGEFLISRAGLGYLIVYGGQVFKLDIVMASVVVLCVLAGGMYYLVAFLQKCMTKHYEK